MGNELADLNTQLQNADQLVRQLAAGETNNLHHVMIELEKAKLNFELVMQIRNKALEAYQDVMRMQL